MSRAVPDDLHRAAELRRNRREMRHLRDRGQAARASLPAHRARRRLIRAGERRPIRQKGGRHLMVDELHPTLLPWHAAGTLNPWSTRQVDEHLKGCASCRLELDALVSMGATLRRHEETGHLAIDALLDLDTGAPEGAEARTRTARAHLAACEA